VSLGGGGGGVKKSCFYFFEIFLKKKIGRISSDSYLEVIFTNNMEDDVFFYCV